MDMNKNKDDLQQRIEQALSNRKIDIDKLSEKTVHEIIEDISIYHQELDFQNQELLRINEDLSALRKQYYDLFDLAPNGYVVFSMEMTILLANQNFVSMFGLHKHDIKKRLITEFIHPEYQDDFYFHTQKLLKEKEVQSLGLLMMGKERNIPVAIRSNLMTDGDTLSIRCVIIDMTKEKAANV